MPVDDNLTPRQLRIIADRVEQLTKARHDNQAMGVPTTPDRFVCRFPSGHRGTVTWTEAPLSSARARERNGGKAVHRYVVQLHTPQRPTPEAPDEAAQITSEHGPELVAHLPQDPDQALAKAERLRKAANQ
ncbi:hypothetical protein F3K34_44365 [Streptomyces sp. LBUM 1486]|uniref:hypothetical protein n=1 Tax=Streptomyces scabiei TaxID=1930 RepID=UPI001B339348|nr:hypothetical protein [Streptomyces sp. LBUM 1486]MBP5918815.1 hypothetical protein [Streptomyces sp. LBUM 1486]